MESFSLLNYWRGTGGPSAADARTTTIAASVFRPSGETDTEDDDDDEGPFFDLEFALPDSDSDGVVVVEDIKNDDSTVNSDEENNDSNRACLTLSPSNTLAVDSKPFQLPVFLLRSATKLRVLMLRFRRPKPVSAEPGNAPVAASNKFFIKVEEVPIVSLFTRGNSSRDTNRPAMKKSDSDDDPEVAVAAEERRVTKEVVQKYLNKIKPLYSKRYGERLRFSGLLNSDAVVGRSVPGSDKKGETQSAVLPMGLRVVGKRFGKSRSAPLAVATVPPPPQDDSLREKQDGIQSAIAHCKRSFNGNRGMDPITAGSASPLVRSIP